MYQYTTEDSALTSEGLEFTPGSAISIPCQNI